MRIMWHAPAAWVRSGYGQQTAVWAPLIASLGHDVFISATYGLWGTTTEWQGLRVLPCGDDRFGNDILAERFKREKADIVIALMDSWALQAEEVKKVNLAHWMPVDCTPLGYLDQTTLLRGRGKPIALSRHGEDMLLNSGFEPAYIPHGIDMGQWRPSSDREAARKALDIGDRFTIGINSVNVDNIRKGVPEQLLAFSRLHREHPDTLMLIHGQVYEVSEPKGLNIGPVIRNLGLTHAVRFVDQYEHKLGMIGQDYLVEWYSALDLYSSCSYAEGFGLTILEAMACGIPVVATDTSSMPEVAGDAGWLVGGDPYWNPVHRAWWGHPSVDEIYHAYETAYLRDHEYAQKKAAARKQAMNYHTDRILPEWDKVLDSLESQYGK